MLRVILFFLFVAAVAAGFAWLADQPGELILALPGYEIGLSMVQAVLALLLVVGTGIFLWGFFSRLFAAPAAISRRLKARREEKGLEALSRGLIAVGAGDAAQAKKYANQAGRALSHQPMADLLEAQSAMLSGDRQKARKIYEAMLESPETELIGLRGLYLEARREKELEAARQFAEQAVRRNPRLAWAVEGLLELQARAGEWAAARETLALARQNGQIDKKTAQRYRAVLLTAEAMAEEDSDMDKALKLALEAHKLAPDLVPAAEVAGRILAAQGNTAKATRVIATTWEYSPHPDLAMAYAHARPGDSVQDRLKRVKALALRTPFNPEGPIAIATVAIEGHDWAEARKALKPLLDKNPTARICTLMARIEGGEFGDKGRVREWLARAVRAPRDPVWIADGFISDRWMPLSPITGKLDAFVWQPPPESLSQRDTAAELEDYVTLAADVPAPSLADEAQGAAEVVAMAGLAKTVSLEETEEEKTIATEAEPPETIEVTPVRESETKAAASETPKESESAPKTKEAVQPTAEDAEIVTAEPSAPSTVADKAKGDKAGEAAASAMPKPRPAARSETSPFRHGGRVTQASTPKPQKSPEPDIFVPPRAPDDPGPEPLDTDERPRLPYRYRYSRS